MAVLKDSKDQYNFIEITAISHHTDITEGSYFVFKYVSREKIMYELNFGWTNQIVQAFIEMLKQFPLEKYNGHFSHYEQHLEIKWDYIVEGNYYNVHFLESDSPIIIQTTKEDLILLGLSFEKEWKESPMTG